jgi:hypothetical protein
MVQELSKIHELLSQPFQEAVSWSEIAITQPDKTLRLAGAYEYFEFLRDRNVHNMEQHWRLIEETAHRQGAPLRQFAFTEPGRLLSLSDELMEAELDRIATARRHAIEDSGKQPGHPDGARGALIYFEPGLSMYDGAAMMGSGGFFDVENFPPADTWVAYITEETGKQFLSGFLLAWVPDELVDLADKGLRVDPSASIRWAHEETSDFVQDLCRRLQSTCSI